VAPPAPVAPPPPPAPRLPPAPVAPPAPPSLGLFLDTEPQAARAMAPVTNKTRIAPRNQEQRRFMSGRHSRDPPRSMSIEVCSRSSGQLAPLRLDDDGREGEDGAYQRDEPDPELQVHRGAERVGAERGDGADQERSGSGDDATDVVAEAGARPAQ